MANAQALAIVTVTDTPFFFDALIKALGFILTLTRKVGIVSAADMEWLTALSITVMGRPSPGTCTSGSACAGISLPTAVGLTIGCARFTSSAITTPPIPEPFKVLRLTCSCADSLRAYGVACLLSGLGAGEVLLSAA